MPKEDGPTKPKPLRPLLEIGEKMQPATLDVVSIDGRWSVLI